MKLRQTSFILLKAPAATLMAKSSLSLCPPCASVNGLVISYQPVLLHLAQLWLLLMDKYLFLVICLCLNTTILLVSVFFWHVSLSVYDIESSASLEQFFFPSAVLPYYCWIIWIRTETFCWEKLFVQCTELSLWSKWQPLAKPLLPPPPISFFRRFAVYFLVTVVFASFFGTVLIFINLIYHEKTVQLNSLLNCFFLSL